MPKFQDLSDRKFGRLTVKSSTIRNQRTYWLCFCECGNSKHVRADSLKSGSIQSCGCLHGDIKRTHGLSKHPLYRVWMNMIQRCYHKNSDRFDSYGKRGIKVCQKWRKDFEEFYVWATNNGWSKSLQIDRVDNNGNYCPSNCRFVTLRENCSNRSRHSKHGVGVKYDKRNRKNPFCAYAMIEGKYTHIGCFSTKKEAQDARKGYLNERGLL